jgi:hypothetical protein
MSTGVNTLVVNTSDRVKDWLSQHQPVDSIALLEPSGRVVFMQKLTDVFEVVSTAIPPSTIIQSAKDRKFYFADEA